MKDSNSDGLETILDDHAEYYIRQTMKFFQNEGESPALSKNNEGDLKAKQQLTAYINEVKAETRKKTASDIFNLAHKNYQADESMIGSEELQNYHYYNAIHVIGEFDG